MALLLLLLLGIVLWVWQANLRARETAWKACALACQRCHVQLLDDTVTLEQFKLQRDLGGAVRPERVYRFEFSDTGLTRQLGRLVMVGQQVKVVYLEGGDLILP